ncbi:hypothetical protein OF83DRAFT_1177768 [Amylostereum chailletii]|nr:hypothetical protein OF83DRAFT_1177768 [Amylostereum chailletii]
MTDDLAATIQKSLICPHLRFVNRATSNPKDRHRAIPDIYATHSNKTPEDEDLDNASSDPHSFTLEEDPFRDPNDVEIHDAKTFDIVNPSPSDSARLRQLSAWAYAQLKFQSRSFVFSVVLMEDSARLIRWDRSGAIVTERFVWTNPTDPLADFLGRFDRLSPEQRGHDPTSCTPTQEEATMARAAFAGSPSADVSPDEPLRKLTVRDDTTNKLHSFIVGSPQWCSRSLAGRATSGYVAFDIKTKYLVYLKDTWRIVGPGMQKEGDIYRRLHAKGVTHIAPMRCAGDVEGQRTRTQDFVSELWACGGAQIAEHQRYRIVLGVVGRPLDSFKSTFELCQAIADAVEGEFAFLNYDHDADHLPAHGQAYTLLKILHRDISAGNIIITDDGRGLLIDWDLCRDLNVPVTTKEPLTGTWQFISGTLLTDPTKEHQLSDDLESFVHVLAYHLVHHRPTGFISPKIESDVWYVYHRRFLIIEEDRVAGGLGKRDIFLSVALSPAGFRGHVPKPCAMLLRDLRHLFRDAFYADLDNVTKKIGRACIAALKTPKRVLDVFRTHLAEDGWPEADESQDGLVGESSRVSAGKRRAPMEKIEFIDPPKKRSREE